MLVEKHCGKKGADLDNLLPTLLLEMDEENDMKKFAKLIENDLLGDERMRTNRMNCCLVTSIVIC